MMELSLDEKLQLAAAALRNVLIEEYRTELALLVAKGEDANTQAARLRDLQNAKKLFQERVRLIQEEQNAPEK